MTKSTIQASNLFKPIKVGNITLPHRIAHLPTTRNRANPETHVPTDLQKQYYTDRAKSGALLVTEATIATPKLGWYPNVPGIWTKEQALGWKQIVDSVHEAGGRIAVQLWGLGRVAIPGLLKQKGFDFVAPSAIYEHEESEKAAKDAGNPLRELTAEEIHQLVTEDYPNAVKLALDVAGFDFVEFHFANGYIASQFINPVINKRTDKYGGPIENRARFLLEALDNAFKVADPKKIAIRVSPGNQFQEPVNPSFKEDFEYITKQLQARADQGNELGFIDVVDGTFDVGSGAQNVDISSILNNWKGIVLRGGRYNNNKDEEWKLPVEDANADDRTLVGFGRNFIANPDLPQRIQEDQDLNPYDRSTFYTIYNYGYNTYPFYGQKTDADPDAKVEGVALA
ncbi:hypothetical protein PVL30_000698 [Lodderomyces elongisporus]|uniref:NADH:flavin oxidoreductase/NADH oxidase N-terminal domain-containing protein n=1 Tax=Lodderomyces elongisporus (strain ATCC 11503 / CBS 2605 / JCM 1781 / NBRC 1676 / NRRL YB-4239) TaxID=379508 RepID=A5DTN8_LODEL|nr:uncharacterized protein PVL30_000698 [Lodderomyces elongisporus]EDK42546.1 conserved hypothetical protein [Lodderomyces elongisporus NRRL YB-4239]WLF76990.1 hypothetical protein PVL30_000698 [Lodderomyces elongisporus]